MTSESSSAAKTFPLQVESLFDSIIASKPALVATPAWAFLFDGTRHQALTKGTAGAVTVRHSLRPDAPVEAIKSALSALATTTAQSEESEEDPTVFNATVSQAILQLVSSDSVPAPALIPLLPEQGYCYSQLDRSS